MTTKFARFAAGFFIIVLTAFAGASAQGPPQRTPAPNDKLVSPEVLSDRRVAFRIYAPKASEVTLRGDWMETPSPAKLEKDENGGQTTRVVTANPDQFAYVAVWSAGVNPQISADFEKRAAAFLDNPDKINKQIKLFSISVGDKDFALAGSKNLAEILKKRSVKHDLQISGGGHTWINWRRYLNEFAPQLFR